MNNNTYIFLLKRAVFLFDLQLLPALQKSEVGGLSKRSYIFENYSVEWIAA